MPDLAHQSVVVAGGAGAVGEGIVRVILNASEYATLRLGKSGGQVMVAPLSPLSAQVADERVLAEWPTASNILCGGRA